MTMENKQLDNPKQPWIGRADAMHSTGNRYSSELRSWVQHVIMEAERNNNPTKVDQFLKLLRDL